MQTIKFNSPSECVLGHDNEDLRDGPSTGQSLLEHGHRKLKLNLLWALQSARQVQNAFAVEFLHREVVHARPLHPAWHAGTNQLQVEFSALVVRGPLEREEGASLRRHRHLRCECDVVVGVRGRLFEALDIVMVAHHRDAATPILLCLVQCVVWWTGDAIATIRTSDVHADLVVATARMLLRALVYILARSAVQPQAVSRGACTHIRTHRVLATSHAQVVRLVDLALVDVMARAVVCGQFKARVAGAAVRSEDIDATLVTDSRLLLALVDIVAGLLGGRMLPESIMALAGVGSDRVNAP